MSAMFPIKEVIAKNPPQRTVRQVVADILLHNDGACYELMEPFLMPPGNTGSRAFDQAKAVFIMVDYDDKNDRNLISMMQSTPRLNERALWDILVQVLRGFGYRIQHGRITGLLEGPKKGDNGREEGEPDVD